MNLITPIFRVSFPNLFKMDKFNQYSVTALFKKDADLEPLYKAIETVAIEEFGPKYRSIKNLKLPTFKAQADMIRTDKKTAEPIHDKDGNPVLWPGCEAGAYAIAFKNPKERPDLYGRLHTHLEPKLITDESEIYSGCYARAFVSVFAYNLQGTAKGVTFRLLGVQKAGDGKPLGAVVNTAEAFTPIEVESFDDDEDLMG